MSGFGTAVQVAGAVIGAVAINLANPDADTVISCLAWLGVVDASEHELTAGNDHARASPGRLLRRAATQSRLQNAFILFEKSR